MNSNLRFPPRSRTRGSAFITVLLYSFLLLTLVASVLQWSLHERRMNARAAYFLEARNAAEALAEYGFSQIATQFSSHASVPSFDPQGSSPLSLPPTHSPMVATDFFYGSNVDPVPYSPTHPTGMELIGGKNDTTATVPANGNLFLIDSNDPNNALDPLKGQWVYRRDIQVLARATVVPPNGDPPVTAYVTEKVSVRGAPLFANAIFYSNNDLEIFPGPQMDIYGPVHCNGNMFVSNQSNSSGLLFHGAVSCSGNIYHAWASESPAGDGTGSEALGSYPVSFVTAAGTMLAMKDSTGTWRDSTLGADSTLFNSSGLYKSTTSAALTQLTGKLNANFRATASQLWGGNLQTAAMSVAAYNPVGTGGQVGADGSGNPIYANVGSVNTTSNTVIDPNAADALGYGAHSMIDPPNTALTTSDPYYTGKSEVENEKFAKKAALYVQVIVTPGTGGNPDTSTVKLFSYPGSAPSGTPASQTGPNGGILLGTAPSGLVTFIPYKATQVSSTASSGHYNVTTTTYSATTSVSTTTTMSSSPGSSQVVNQGLYDQRQLAGINLVQIDMTALRAALNDVGGANADGKAIVDASNNVWGAGSNGTGYDPTVANSTGWNGAMYVDVKTSDNSATQTSVAVANGKVSSGSSLLPTVNGTNGLTVATNAPMYVVGNFNADGSNTTTSGVNGAATTPDDGRTDAIGTTASAESPVALAADAITILSPGYFAAEASNGSSVPTSNSSSTNAGVSWSTAKPNASGTIEVAAAFITGLVSTTSAANSGGAHNLPRFLENWNPSSGQLTVCIRGSLVSMYKSKIATKPFSGAYYGAPQRNWGFDKIFQNGHFPPVTPKVMSYRRTDFSDMSYNDTVRGGVTIEGYSSARRRLWPSLP